MNKISNIKLPWEIIDKILIVNRFNKNAIKILLENKRYYILSTHELIYGINFSISINNTGYLDYLLKVKGLELHGSYYRYKFHIMNINMINYIVSNNYKSYYYDFLRKNIDNQDCILDIEKLKYAIDKDIINLMDLIDSNHIFKFELIKYYIESKHHKIEFFEINKQIEFIDTFVWINYTRQHICDYNKKYTDYDILRYLTSKYNYKNLNLNIIDSIRHSVNFKHKNLVLTSLHIREAIKFHNFEILEYLIPLNKITFDIAKLAIDSQNKEIMMFILEYYCKNKKITKKDISMIIPIDNLHILHNIIPTYIKYGEINIKHVELAIETKNIQLIKYIIPFYLEKNQKINSHHINHAIKTKNIQIIKYLVHLYLENNEKIYKTHKNHAIQTNNLSIIDYIVPLYVEK